jgi:hypothetical protein
VQSVGSARELGLGERCGCAATHARTLLYATQRRLRAPVRHEELQEVARGGGLAANTTAEGTRASVPDTSGTPTGVAYRALVDELTQLRAESERWQQLHAERSMPSLKERVAELALVVSGFKTLPLPDGAAESLPAQYAKVRTHHRADATPAALDGVRACLLACRGGCCSRSLSSLLTWRQGCGRRSLTSWATMTSFAGTHARCLRHRIQLRLPLQHGAG